jgi:hypothetical protein
MIAVKQPGNRPNSAGYFGGLIDDVLSLFINVFLVNIL